MLLNDEPDTADLRAKVARAWQEFARALAEQVGTLPDGGHLQVTLDPTASGTGDARYSVTLTAGADVTAYAVGNASLPPEYQLDRAAIAAMVALGWSPPGVEPDSGDRFAMSVERARAARLSAIVCRTLRDIYGAPHPAFLVYRAADGDGAPLSAGQLGTARAAATPAPGSVEYPVHRDPTHLDLSGTAELADGAPDGTAERADGAPDDAASLREQVRAVLAAMPHTTLEELPDDPDGDIGIRAGTAMVFARVRADPPLVDVLSPVLTDVTPDEQLYRRLSELTNRMPVGRLYCADQTVWASVPVFGRSFQPTHLVLAVQVMTGLADELDEHLQHEFGGRRFFADADGAPTPPQQPAASTGMYL